METKIVFDERNQVSPEHLPSLFKYATSNDVAGFDTIPSPREDHTIVKGLDGSNTQEDQTTVISMSSATSTSQPQEYQHRRSISISMPTSPSSLDGEQSRRVLLNDIPGTNSDDPVSNHYVYLNVSSSQPPRKPMFISQPLQTMVSQSNKSMLRSNRMKDKRYDSFKTWSGKLERQISNLRGKPQEPEEISETVTAEPEAVPAVDRYFDALEGPELETLKSSEELVLPEDQKWPFLLRFPISSFGMCLGVSSQAILWKTLATTRSLKFLQVSPDFNLILWCISLVLLAVVALIYLLKVTFYFEAVRREYYHPVRVNFFFAPWIACLFLAIGMPPTIAVDLHASVWYVLMTPILCLELKIYGQWMSGGQRRLSKVANPSNHLAVVGNFVGALLGASMGLKEGPTFFFAIGLAHYTVLFVTLYQRLPTNETLPKELHPVFFLFIAAPSVACMAWAKISGEFDYGSRLAYFIALFLYISLAVRVNFFRGFRFSLSWWAYTFPMTGAAIATIRYSNEVNNWFTDTLSIALSAISTITVSALFLSTVLHAFVLHDLFPNDISIAIKGKRPKSKKKHFHRRNASSDAKDVEARAPV